jgi:hypothetical protein
MAGDDIPAMIAIADINETSHADLAFVPAVERVMDAFLVTLTRFFTSPIRNLATPGPTTASLVLPE